MIYLFYGNDVSKVREKAFAWVATAKIKEPSLAYFRLVREELTSAVLEDASLSSGLFVKRLLILVDDPFPSMRSGSGDDTEGEESGSTLEEHLDVLAASNNVIIILAPKLPAAKAKKIIAKAKASYHYEKPVGLSRGFNTSLVNALAVRDREKVWTELHRALRAGDAPEMLHGLLHWKARDLMEKGSRTWTNTEARALSLSLIALLQESRRGGLDLSLSLEKFALSV